MTTRTRRGLRWLVLLPAVVLGLSLAVHAQDTPPDATPDAGPPPGAPEVGGEPAAPESEEEEAPPNGGQLQTVSVGLYLHHVPELDLKSNTYLADFYLWFRWKGDIDPTQTFEFTNGVETWDVMRTAIYVDDEGNPEPDTLEGGYKYQCYHVQGRFHHSFDVRQYPFDAQQMVVELEDAEYTTTQLVYVVDNGSQFVHPGLEIPGWIIGRPEATVRDSVYPTNFGDTRRQGGEDNYTQFRYTLNVERPVVGYLVKTILPVAIVMLITFVIFLIDSKYFEGRLGLGITGLISAVALQLTAAGDLPNVGYMVLLDQVYNVSYLVIFLSLLESVVAVRLADADKPKLAQRLDIFSLFFCASLFFGGVALIIVFR